MIKEEIKNVLGLALKELEISLQTIAVDYPVDYKHGDYSTNVALVAAKKAKKNPRELAEVIVEKLKTKNEQLKIFDRVEIAGPGFINFWLKEEKLLASIDSLLNNKVYIDTVSNSFTDKKIMVEFAHPNTHKAFHIGHLRNITTGESIVRLLEAVGVKVIRANYQGDVGMHIAKCLYGLLQNASFKVQNANLTIEEKVEMLGKAYAQGSKTFEENENARKEIGEINKKIYAKDPDIWDLYRTTRQWSLDYFEFIYKRVYSHFDRLYFESEVYEAGRQNVLEGLKKGIFQKSEGAIIFPGSKYGLHDRVFISSEGNPTYEGKDMGLAPLQHKEYHPDLIIHVLGPEQFGYTRVIFKALDLLFPEDAGKQLHLVYGWVKLKHGKMSSRTGNVILGEWLLDEAKKRILASYETSDQVAEQVAVAAVKYSFLKVGLSQEIAFDLEESISLQGNSGPYLQYTYVRTKSLLEKAGEHRGFKFDKSKSNITPEERDVLRLLSRFPEIVAESAQRYAPHVLCTYLFDLAQVFNLFYQKLPILKTKENERDLRLHITEFTGIVLKNGLYLLGISAPEKM